MWYVPILEKLLTWTFGVLYAKYLKPWLDKLKADKNFQRAIEIAGPLIEMAERGDLFGSLDGKYEAVFDNVKLQLSKEGIELRTYLINNAIEIAIVALTEAGVINLPMPSDIVET